MESRKSEERESEKELMTAAEKEELLDRKIQMMKKKNEERMRKFQEIEEDRKWAEREGRAVSLKASVISDDEESWKLTSRYEKKEEMLEKDKRISAEKDARRGERGRGGEGGRGDRGRGGDQRTPGQAGTTYGRQISPKLASFAGEGPPPDPVYNFLADDSRDWDSSAVIDDNNQSQSRENRRNPRGGGQLMDSAPMRGGGGGTRGGYGRPRGSGRSQRQRPFGRNNWQRNDNDDNRSSETYEYKSWLRERDDIDRERVDRQRTRDGGWKREWDHDKTPEYISQQSSHAREPAAHPKPSREVGRDQPFNAEPVDRRSFGFENNGSKDFSPVRGRGRGLRSRGRGSPTRGALGQQQRGGTVGVVRWPFSDEKSDPRPDPTRVDAGPENATSSDFKRRRHDDVKVTTRVITNPESVSEVIKSPSNARESPRAAGVNPEQTAGRDPKGTESESSLRVVVVGKGPVHGSGRIVHARPPPPTDDRETVPAEKSAEKPRDGSGAGESAGSLLPTPPLSSPGKILLPLPQRRAKAVGSGRLGPPPKAKPKAHGKEGGGAGAVVPKGILKKGRKPGKGWEDVDDDDGVPIGIAVITTPGDDDDDTENDGKEQSVTITTGDGTKNVADGDDGEEEDWEDCGDGDIDDEHNESSESFERFIEQHTLRLDVNIATATVDKATVDDGQAAALQFVSVPFSPGGGAGGGASSQEMFLKTPTGYVRVIDWGAEMDKLSQEQRLSVELFSPDELPANWSLDSSSGGNGISVAELLTLRSRSETEPVERFESWELKESDSEPATTAQPSESAREPAAATVEPDSEPATGGARPSVFAREPDLEPGATVRLSESARESAATVEREKEPIERLESCEPDSEPSAMAQPSEPDAEPAAMAQPSEPVIMAQPSEPISEPATMAQPSEPISEPATMAQPSEPAQEPSGSDLEPRAITELSEPAVKTEPSEPDLEPITASELSTYEPALKEARTLEPSSTLEPNIMPVKGDNDESFVIEPSTSEPSETLEPSETCESSTSEPYETLEPSTTKPSATCGPSTSTTQPSTNEPSTLEPSETHEPSETREPAETFEPSAAVPVTASEPSTLEPSETHESFNPEPSTEPSARSEPSTSEPSTTQPSMTEQFTTNEPSTIQLTETFEPSTAEPSETTEPSTTQPSETDEPSSSVPVTSNDPSTAEPSETSERSTSEEPHTTRPSIAEPSTSDERAASEPPPASELNSEKPAADKTSTSSEQPSATNTPLPPDSESLDSKKTYDVRNERETTSISNDGGEKLPPSSNETENSLSRTDSKVSGFDLENRPR